jgi:energy-coupling factor transporter ATP-binding protein EcfA2
MNKANFNPKQGTTLIMITHDKQIAAHTERMLFLSDVKITKEKEGLHLAKKLICPYCHTKLKPENEVCPACGKTLALRKLLRIIPAINQNELVEAKGDV